MYVEDADHTTACSNILDFLIASEKKKKSINIENGFYA